MTTGPGPARARRHRGHTAPRFAAIDLGTNNCRLLVASPRGGAGHGGFRVLDAFSRIVRLGEGVSASGLLSEAAMDRTMDALAICADKMRARGVTASRAIATQACRLAGNGAEFLGRVRDRTGLEFDVVTPEEEAKLAARGCADLIDGSAEGVLVFDIGGGSTEMSWLRTGPSGPVTQTWTSFPFGVVTLAEQHGGKDMDRSAYDAMVAHVAEEVAAFTAAGPMAPLFAEGRAHLIGTSGTVTSLAGVKMGLLRYSRREVDGVWLSASDVRAVSERLRAMGYERRGAQPCIGVERADLVVPGCAILEGIMQVWPSDRIRVGDRGLREGMLIELIEAHRQKDRA